MQNPAYGKTMWHCPHGRGSVKCACRARPVSKRVGLNAKGNPARLLMLHPGQLLHRERCADQNLWHPGPRVYYTGGEIALVREALINGSCYSRSHRTVDRSEERRVGKEGRS